MDYGKRARPDVTEEPIRVPFISAGSFDKSSLSELLQGQRGKCFHERVIKQILSVSFLPPQQGAAISLTEGGKMVINSPDEEISGS